MLEFTKLDSRPHSHRIQKSLMSMREGRSATLPTYAVITSHSYHTGGVNVLLMDGSVRMVADSVAIEAWRGLGSRAGDEIAIQFE